jgi:hypothetical protein
MSVDLTKFVALQIHNERIGIVLSGKVGEDVALILDDPTPIVPDAQYTSFSVETYSSGGGEHPISLWARMTFDELRQLAGALKAQEHRLPPALHTGLFHAFLHDVRAELAEQPSARFNDVRFASVARDAGGAIVGHYGLGVDLAGTIDDCSGTITVEQHVVPLPPGHFRRLSRADRLSLAAALAAFVKAQPNADPLWMQIAADAAR